MTSVNASAFAGSGAKPRSGRLERRRCRAANFSVSVGRANRSKSGSGFCRDAKLETKWVNEAEQHRHAAKAEQRERRGQNSNSPNVERRSAHIQRLHGSRFGE